MFAYDRSLALRTVLLGLGLALLAFGVQVITDEPGSTLSLRAARLCAFVPALALASGAIVRSQAAARGELRALAALGASPLRRALGVVLGGWLLAAVATAALLSPSVDPSSLFPRVQKSESWVVAKGALRSDEAGVSVAPDGSLTFVGKGQQAPALPAPMRSTAALAVGPLGLVAPLWLAARLRSGARLMGLAVTLGAALLAFHAVAAGVVSAWWMPGCSAALALQTLYARWSEG